MPQQDPRARLSPKSMMNSMSILGPDDQTNILFPLRATRGVLFPYTPSVTTGNVAEYDPLVFTQTNYGYNAYIKSSPKPITITAEFTAQTNTEALYLLAVLHFFKSITKSYFGVQTYDLSGTPPPTLIFNYLGQYQFNNVPILVKNFDYTMPADIDYVPVNTTNLNPTLQSDILNTGSPPVSSGGFTWLPTRLTVNLEMDTQYIPAKIRNEFNLDEFRSGKLVGQGYI